MLEMVDMSKKVSKVDHNELMDRLGEQLGLAQRNMRAANRPVIIVFEGWRGSRRSSIINEMMQAMDARGFDVHSSVRISDDLHHQPPFAFFWKHLPALGHIAVYHRSWYYLKNLHDVKGKDEKELISYEHINAFEKTLTDDNYVIIKFFLHLSEEQQKENLKKNEKTLGKAWRDLNPALDESGHYKEYYDRYEKMLRETDNPNAPWHIIAADDKRSANIEVFTTLINVMEAALKEEKAPAPVERPSIKYDVLSKVNANKELSKEDYKVQLDKYQKRLKLLQIEMFKAQIPTVIGFEGWDAAGKGGAIRRLTAALDPLGYCVHPVASPNVVERQFNYQWRFWIHLPEPGNITIFDRTWYGRVMVERLEGFATTNEWQRAYDEMNDMEQQWVEHGMVICKFWLQIDKDEQLRRFTDRQNDPLKQWKITEEDWRNRDKWGAYEEAVSEMLVRTSTSYAPWTIVEGNNKYFARLKVLKTVIDAFEAALKKAGVDLDKIKD